MDSFEGMIGTSKPILEVFSSLRKVATSDVPVLVTGESGTGKELAARAIHRLSGRKDGPFIVINCGAIPENLLESELFGHEKGSFTGAHIQRKGRIELAQGGTLFLDEIGELAAVPPGQAAAVSSGADDRAGRRARSRSWWTPGSWPPPTGILRRRCRRTVPRGPLLPNGVIVYPYPSAAREGRATSCCWPRLLFCIVSPRKVGRKVSGFTTQAGQVLEKHPWPGNVRELENRIKRAVVMAEGDRITPADLEMEALYGYAGTDPEGCPGRGGKGADPGGPGTGTRAT